MQEERLMILQMLADGKISPEEAEALLDAIDVKPNKASRKEETGTDNWGGFFRSFMSGDPFQEEFDTSPKSISAEEGTSLIVRGNLGSFIFMGTDGSDVSVSGAARGQYRLYKADNEIHLRTGRLGGALTVHVPNTVQRLRAKSNVGRVAARELPKELTDVSIRANTGQIIFDTKALTEGSFRLKSHVGKIDLYIPIESACKINASYKMGAIDYSDLPLEIIAEGLGFLKGSLNGGGADIRLSSNLGHISIHRKETKPQ